MRAPASTTRSAATCATCRTTRCASQEQAAAFRELLQNILSVNLTLETKALSEASNDQNEEVKKISAWAAILFAPSLVGTIYGMNFDAHARAGLVPRVSVRAGA